MLITLDPDESFHARIARHADDAGLRDEPRPLTSRSALTGLVDQGMHPDAVLLGPNVPPRQGVEIAQWLAGAVPGVIVLQVALPTTEALRAALRAGIRDVLAPDFSPADLAEALAAAGYDARGDDALLPGATIAVFSAKGGVGTSVVACNLALRLSASTGATAVLADLDLGNADQGVMLGLRTRFTIQDVADGSVGRDTEAIEQVLVPVPDTDVRLLAGPVDPAAAESITDDAVADVLHRLRCVTGLVVADTGSAFNDTTLTVLETADAIVLPVSLDVLSLRSLTVTLQTFDRLGIDRSRLHVVAVRADAKVGLTLDDVARTTGVAVDVAIPSSRDVPRSVNTATPLALDAPRNAVVKAIDELVARLVEGLEIHGASDDTSSRRGLFRRGGGSSEPSPPVVPAPQPVVEAPAREPALDEEPEPVVEPDPEPVADDTPSAPPARRVVVARATPVAEVIDMAVGASRLAALPPPELDTAPVGDAEDASGRRRRRGNRS